MNRYYSYLNSAKEIISAYKGEEPLSAYLKFFFASNKKYGSKDRKTIAHLCYCYFRLGKLAIKMELVDAVIAGLFLCSDSFNEILAFLKPEWNELIHLSVAEKLKKINIGYSITAVFPWNEQLSNGIDHDALCQSFTIQPDLFLRIRPGYERKIKESLSAAAIPYSVIGNACISLSNNSKVDTIIELDKNAVVQDLSSQRIGELMQVAINHLPSSISVWDCCAASGGKSILCYDLNPGIHLSVSDIRESMLANLRKRFAKAGIEKYKNFITDLSKSNKNTAAQYYDFIIADVPCSGSGTWSRTPEQLYFFNETRIEKYGSLQRKILTTVADGLKPGGFLLYITCSVFKEENEGVVEFIRAQKELELKSMKLFAGYNQKADTLFGALLYKPL